MSCNPNARYFIGDESQKPRYQAHIGYKVPAPNAYRLPASNYAIKTTNLYDAIRSAYRSPSYAAMARGMPVYRPVSESTKTEATQITQRDSESAAVDSAQYNWAYTKRQTVQPPRAPVSLTSAPVGTRPKSFADLQERLAEMVFAPRKQKRAMYETDYELYQTDRSWMAESAAS